jgi:hypothetical protein
VVNLLPISLIISSRKICLINSLIINKYKDTNNFDIPAHFNVRFRISGTTLCRGECEINEQMEWCPEGDTHGVSELITHSH